MPADPIGERHRPSGYPIGTDPSPDQPTCYLLTRQSIVPNVTGRSTRGDWSCVHQLPSSNAVGSAGAVDRSDHGHGHVRRSGRRGPGDQPVPAGARHRRRPASRPPAGRSPPRRRAVSTVGAGLRRRRRSTTRPTQPRARSAPWPSRRASPPRSRASPGSGPRLASQGFVVITIDTNSTLRPAGQPGDPAAGGAGLPDQHQLGAHPRSTRTRLAVMGHSMGGGGTLEAAHRPTRRCRPPSRCRRGTPTRPGPGIRVPTLIIGAENDSVASVSSHSIPFYNSMPASPDKAYLELNGASHFAPNSLEHDHRRSTAISWLKRFVDNDTRYEQFLCGSPHQADLSQRRLLGLPGDVPLLVRAEELLGGPPAPPTPRLRIWPRPWAAMAVAVRRGRHRRVPASQRRRSLYHPRCCGQ